MPRDEPRAELLALAALYKVARDANKAPIERTLWLRALLSLLYARRVEGGLEPYREFWRTAIDTWEGDGSAGVAYARSCHTMTQWCRIVRTLGLEPQSPELQEAVSRLLRPEAAAAAKAVVEGGLTRDIIATKGHPHSEAGRALMDERIADGKHPDGEKW